MDSSESQPKRSTCKERAGGSAECADTGHRIQWSGDAALRRGRHLRQQQGVPSGERHELCRGLHAEQNVIIQAALHGAKLAGATVYCTHHPCVVCAKMLINAGVARVVFRGDYPDELARQMLSEAGVEISVFPKK